MAVLLPQPGFASTSPTVRRNLQLSHIDSTDGLSQEHVVDITQDARGFLWIATQEGLNRYDGYEVKSYEHRSDQPESLSNDFVNTLTVDREGVLWVGTANGVNRYRATGDRFDSDPFAGIAGAYVGDDHVLDLLETRDGSLWIATQGSGVVRVDRSTARATRYRHRSDDVDSLPDDTVHALLEDARGQLWVGTASGLARFDPVAERFVGYALATGPKDAGVGQVRALFEDRTGALWIGTGNDGAVRFDPRRNLVERFRHDDADPMSLGNERVRDIVEDVDGTLWLATDEGLSEWRPDSRSFVNYLRNDDDPGSLPSNQINTLFLDAGGVLWIGTWSGVARWNHLSDAFTYFRAANGLLPGDVVTSVAEASDGTLWVGTYGTGLATIDPVRGEHRFYRHDPLDPGSLPDDRVMAVHVDAGDAVWVGTRAGGLARLRDDGSGFDRFTHDPARAGSLSSNAVTSMLSDPEGNLWIGTFGGGLNRTRVDTPGDFRRYTADPADPGTISGNRVLKLYRDREGIMWVTTDSAGLNRFDEASGQFIRFAEFEAGPRQAGPRQAEPRQAGPRQAEPRGPRRVVLETVFDVMEDHRGDFWMGTLGQGLVRWPGHARRADAATLEVYGKSEGLPTETVYAVMEDQNGALWLSSNRGLTRFDAGAGSVRQFDTRSGLRDNEFNQGASLRSRSGRLLFGSKSGLVSFLPLDLGTNERPPSVVVTARSRQAELASAVSGRPTATVEVSYLDRFIGFDFVALDFTSPDKNQYRYRLDGFDDGWIHGDDYRRATYTNLPSGTFTFHVQGSNNDGVWNEEGAAISVRVVPPPWSTWWAYALYAIIALLLPGFVVRSQRLKLRRESQQRVQLEEQVRVRTEELASRNADLVALNERLAEASVTDSLTGLRNRRYVDQFIASQVALFERGQASQQDPGRRKEGAGRADCTMLFFMMIDLDGFKLINDCYGHHAGDQALLQVADLLRASCRTSDTLVRWGGDEFMVLGFASALSGVKVLAERIRDTVAAHRYALGNGQEGRLSASIGIATYPLAEDHRWFSRWERVAGVADQAAYIAKANGRNAWVSISGSEHLEAGILERFNSELPGLVQAGRLKIDSSLDDGLMLPGADDTPGPMAVSGSG